MTNPMTDTVIAIVDYQAGNLRSVQKALERFDVCAKITSDSSEIESADGVVFPGQGACDSSMRQLRSRGLVEPIKASISSGKPFLGECPGLQLLLEESDEGDEPPLGVIRGRVKRLPDGLKIPHMGWNQVSFTADHPIFKGVPQDSYFYFVHSYYADPEDKGIVAGTTDYGIEFVSAVAWDNVVGVQFHPEKSGNVGLRVYENFIGMVTSSKLEGVWKSSPR